MKIISRRRDWGLIRPIFFDVDVLEPKNVTLDKKINIKWKESEEALQQKKLSFLKIFWNRRNKKSSQADDLVRFKAKFKTLKCFSKSKKKTFLYHPALIAGFAPSCPTMQSFF